MKKIKKQLTLNNISLFCVYFFPISLVIGPFVGELLMNTLVIIFIYSCFIKKKWIFVKTKFFKIFIVFYFYIIVNSIYSDYTNFILLKNIFYFRYGIFIIAVLNLIETNKCFLLKFYKVLIYTILIITIDGFIQFFTGQNIIGFGLERPDRLSGFFKDELIIGSFLSKLLFIALTLFFYNEQNLSKFSFYLTISTLFLTFILILLSGERAAFLITILGAFLILFSLFRLRHLICFAVLFLSVIIIGSLNDNVKERHIDQTTKQVQSIKTDGNFLDTFRYYGAIYNTSYNAFKQKKIFGQGANTFRYFCNKLGIESFNLSEKNKNNLTNGITYANGCTTHSHQFYLQLLSELGFVGFLYIFSTFLYFVIQFIKFCYLRFIINKVIYKDYEVLAIINIILTLWPLTTNGNFFNNWVNMLMVLPFIFAVNFSKKLDK